MIGRSIALPAASKSPPKEVEREKGSAALGFPQSNCKRRVKKYFRERRDSRKKKEIERSEKRKNCVIIFVIYLGEILDRILMRRVFIL